MSIQPDQPNGLLISPSSLEELQHFSCSYPSCDYKDSREDRVARHEEHHNPSSERDFPCQVCQGIFGGLDSFLHHMSSHHGDKLLCPVCPFQAEALTEFQPHILTHTLTVNSVPKIGKKVGNTTATVPRCAICPVIFPTREGLSQHLKECSRKLNPFESSAKKSKTHHGPKSCEHPKRTGEISISSSSRSSSSIMTSKRSIARNNHLTTVFRCAICSITFTNHESLAQHLKKCCRKLKPKTKVKKFEAHNLDASQSQESPEGSKRMDEFCRVKTEEIPNSETSSFPVIVRVEGSTAGSILGL